MITLKSSKELLVNKDSPYRHDSMDETDSAGGNRVSLVTSNEEKTVFTTEDGNTKPIIVGSLEPEIRGVLVVCEGGNDVKVVAKIKEAVEALFQIEAHKVIVCAM